MNFNFFKMTSHTKLPYRKIKRIGTPINDETKNTKTYEFFQKLISSFILILKNEKGIIKQ